MDTDGNLQPFVAKSANGTFGNALAVFTIDDQISQFVARIARAPATLQPGSPRDVRIAGAAPFRGT